jgi:hypothetical protein
MTKIVLRTRTNEPEDLERPVFCLSCRNRCLVVADDFGERVTEERKISRKDAKEQRSGREDTGFSNATSPPRLKVRTKFPAIRTERKITSERLVFNVRSYRSGLILSPLLILKRLSVNENENAA